MILNPQNTYFFDTNAEVAENHAYVFGGPAKDFDDNEIDSALYKSIQEKIIRYNLGTLTSGLKILAERRVIEVKKELWATTPHLVLTVTYCTFLFMITDFVVFNSGLFTLDDEPPQRSVCDLFDSTPSICARLDTLIIFFLYLTKGFLSYKAFAIMNRCWEEEAPKKQLHARFWKIINLKIIPSSTAELFRGALENDPRGEQCRNSFIPRMLLLSRFTHPFKNKNGAYLESSMIALEEKVFLDHLSNDVENSVPLDPITWGRISPYILWTSRTIAFNKCILTINSALKAIWKKERKSEGEIPHPLWDMMMPLKEKEKFLEHLAALMGLDVKSISDCWAGDDALLTALAEEELTKQDPNWKQEEGWERELQNMKNRLPEKRFSQLPTYPLVAELLNLC